MSSELTITPSFNFDDFRKNFLLCFDLTEDSLLNFKKVSISSKKVFKIFQCGNIIKMENFSSEEKYVFCYFRNIVKLYFSLNMRHTFLRHEYRIYDFCVKDINDGISYESMLGASVSLEVFIERLDFLKKIIFWITNAQMDRIRKYMLAENNNVYKFLDVVNIFLYLGSLYASVFYFLQNERPVVVYDFLSVYLCSFNFLKFCHFDSFVYLQIVHFSFLPLRNIISSKLSCMPKNIMNDQELSIKYDIFLKSLSTFLYNGLYHQDLMRFSVGLLTFNTYYYELLFMKFFVDSFFELRYKHIVSIMDVIILISKHIVLNFDICLNKNKDHVIYYLPFILAMTILVKLDALSNEICIVFDQYFNLFSCCNSSLDLEQNILNVYYFYDDFVSLIDIAYKKNILSLNNSRYFHIKNTLLLIRNRDIFLYFVNNVSVYSFNNVEKIISLFLFYSKNIFLLYSSDFRLLLFDMSFSRSKSVDMFNTVAIFLYFVKNGMLKKELSNCNAFLRGDGIFKMGVEMLGNGMFFEAFMYLSPATEGFLYSQILKKNNVSTYGEIPDFSIDVGCYSRPILSSVFNIVADYFKTEEHSKYYCINMDTLDDYLINHNSVSDKVCFLIFNDLVETYGLYFVILYDFIFFSGNIFNRKVKIVWFNNLYLPYAGDIKNLGWILRHRVSHGLINDMSLYSPYMYIALMWMLTLYTLSPQQIREKTRQFNDEIQKQGFLTIKLS